MSVKQLTRSERASLDWRGAHRAAFWRGARAQDDGQPKAACPYAGETASSLGYRRAWLDGWRERAKEKVSMNEPDIHDWLAEQACPTCGQSCDFEVGEVRYSCPLQYEVTCTAMGCGARLILHGYGIPTVEVEDGKTTWPDPYWDDGTGLPFR